MRSTVHGLLAAGLVFGSMAAAGDPITYSGVNPGAVNHSSAAAANAAAAEYDAAAGLLGDVNVEDLESQPTGPVNDLEIAPGVVMGGQDFFGDPQLLVDASSFPTCGNACGFNTTAGGTNFLELYAGYATFTFAEAIQGFGAYFSGIESPRFGTVTMTAFYDDGSFLSWAIPSGPRGATFFGIIDADRSILSVRIDAVEDLIGIDDIRWFSATNGVEVPEPGSLALLGLGLVGLGFTRRRRAH